MKVRYLLLSTLLSGVIILQGCSSSGSENSLNDLENATASKGKSGGNKCLLDYAEKLDELLTRELAGETVQYTPEDAEKDYSKVLSNPLYHSVRYSWKSDRTKSMSFGAHEVMVPVRDEVALYGINPVTYDEFKQRRRNVTDEELAEMNKRISETLSGQTENEAVKKQLEKLEKMGVDQSTVQGMSSSVTGMAGKVAQSYSEVSGLGDAAAWNSYEQRLYVLDRGVEFAVAVSAGEDENVNKEKSVALAKKILNICD